MALGQKRNTALVPQAAQALEQLKNEVSSEVSGGPDPQAQTLQSWYQTGYGGEVPSRVWGSVGGNMVRRMIAGRAAVDDSTGDPADAGGFSAGPRSASGSYGVPPAKSYSKLHPPNPDGAAAVHQSLPGANSAGQLRTVPRRTQTSRAACGRPFSRAALPCLDLRCRWYGRLTTNYHSVP